MDQTVEALIKTIKQDKRYLDYVDNSRLLEDTNTKQLLVDYQNAFLKLKELKQYEKYIDNSQAKEEFYNLKQQVANDNNIQKYYQSYHDLNDFLHELTLIIFKDISEELDLTGIKL